MDIQEIVEETNKFFVKSNLRAFLIDLPLQGVKAEINRNAIFQKILKNESNYDRNVSSELRVMTESLTMPNPEEEGRIIIIAERLTQTPSNSDKCAYGSDSRNANPQSPSQSTPSRKWRARKSVPHNISPEAARGLPQEGGSDGRNLNPGDQLCRPVAGGVIYLRLEDSERHIRSIWCRRNLEKVESDKLTSVLCIRLIAEAFRLTSKFDHSRNLSDDVLSISEKCLVHFPDFAVNFLQDQDKGIGLGRHCEGGRVDSSKHRVDPRIKCPCLKHRGETDVTGFWGYNGKRFLDSYKKRLKDLIPYYGLSSFARSRSFENTPRYSDGSESSSKRIRINRYLFE